MREGGRAMYCVAWPIRRIRAYIRNMSGAGVGTLCMICRARYGYTVEVGWC